MPPKRSSQTNRKRTQSTNTAATTATDNSRKTKTKVAVAVGDAREKTVNEHNTMSTANNTKAITEFDFHSISVDGDEAKTNADASQRVPSQPFRPTRSIAQSANAQHRKRSRSEKDASVDVENTLTAHETPFSNQPTYNFIATDINEVKRDYSHYTSSTERSSLGANTLQILLAPNFNNVNNKNNTDAGADSHKGSLSAPKSDKDVTIQSTTEAQVNGPISSISPAEGIIDIYRSSNGPAVALCGLLNFVIKAAGVTSVELDSEALKDGANVNVILEEIYANINDDNSNSNNANRMTEIYALGNKDAKYKRFRRAFPDFFDQLMRFAFTSNVLLDDTLLPVLTQWLMAMSESKSRAFRHTATVALLGILRGLYYCYNRAEDVQTEQRESAKENKKKKKEENETFMLGIKEWTEHLFTQSVHQRLRDVAPEIRLVVCQELKTWIKQKPAVFLDNKYLRYFGMALHDKKPEIRAEALDLILHSLARITDAYDKMHAFLHYFINRLVEMSADVDVRCAELAIRVIAMIVRADAMHLMHDNDATQHLPHHHEEIMLTNSMIDRVLLTLFDERPSIRLAAGTLLKVFIHSRVDHDGEESEQLQSGCELIASFALTLRREYHEQMPEKYIVDALWTPERPPPMLLTHYKSFLTMAQSNEQCEVVISLHLLANILRKAQDKLNLGPSPKDDRQRSANFGAPSTSVNVASNTTSGTTAMINYTNQNINSTNNRKNNSNRNSKVNAKVNIAKLVEDISKDAGAILHSSLQKFHNDAEVIEAVSEVASMLDLSVFATEPYSLQLSAFMIELKKVCMSIPFNVCTNMTSHQEQEEQQQQRQQEQLRMCIINAWYVLSFSDHPLRSEAETHLQELVTCTLQEWSSVELEMNKLSKEMLTINNDNNSTSRITKANMTSMREKSKKNNNEKKQSLFYQIANVWNRVHVISSLLSLQEYWPRLLTNIRQCVQWQSTNKNEEELCYPYLQNVICTLRSMLAVAMNTLLWIRQSDNLDGTAHDGHSKMEECAREYVQLLLEILEMNALSLTQTREDVKNLVNQANNLHTSESSNIHNENDAVNEERNAEIKQQANKCHYYRKLLQVDAFTLLCDTCALLTSNLTQHEQEVILAQWEAMMHILTQDVKCAQDAHKAITMQITRKLEHEQRRYLQQQQQQQQNHENNGNTTVTEELEEHWLQNDQSTEDENLEAKCVALFANSRAACSCAEARLMRIVLGASRLFALELLSVTLAPRFFVHWTRVAFKPVTELFKSLFHTLRERAGESFSMERDILFAGYNACVQQDISVSAQEELYQLGSKLASMHFSALDRYYSACVQIIHFAIYFAASTDPLLLQATVPYCSKLRVEDAFRIVQHDLSHHDIFTSLSQPCIRIFCTALRKAARLSIPVSDTNINTTRATPSELNRTAVITTTSNAANVTPNSEHTSIQGIAEHAAHNAYIKEELSSAKGNNESELFSQTVPALTPEITEAPPAQIRRTREVNFHHSTQDDEEMLANIIPSAPSISRSPSAVQPDANDDAPYYCAEDNNSNYSTTEYDSHKRSKQEKVSVAAKVITGRTTAQQTFANTVANQNTSNNNNKSIAAKSGVNDSVMTLTSSPSQLAPLPINKSYTSRLKKQNKVVKTNQIESMQSILNERTRPNKIVKGHITNSNTNYSIVNAPSDTEIALSALANDSYSNDDDDVEQTENVDNDALNSDEVFIATDDYE